MVVLVKVICCCSSRNYQVLTESWNRIAFISLQKPQRHPFKTMASSSFHMVRPQNQRNEFYSLDDLKKKGRNRPYPPMLDSQITDDESFGAHSYNNWQDNDADDDNLLNDEDVAVTHDYNENPTTILSKATRKITTSKDEISITTTTANQLNQLPVDTLSDQPVELFPDIKSEGMSSHEKEQQMDTKSAISNSKSSSSSSPKYSYGNESIENLERSLQDVTNKIYELNGGSKLNLNSSRQVSQILFQGNVQSTSRDVLEEVASRGNEMAKLILEYRTLRNQVNNISKKQQSIMKGTYVQNAMSVVKPKLVDVAQPIVSDSDIYETVELESSINTNDKYNMSSANRGIHSATEMEETISDPLILLDASSYIFRAYYTMPPIHRASDGMPTGAVMGFCKMMNSMFLDRMLSSSVPPRVILCFDAKGKTFRHDLYEQYKANRPPAPIDLIPQFDLVREAACAYGICRIEAPQYEADDVIATISHMALQEGLDTNIISGDKDLMQLITIPNGSGPCIQMIDPVKKDRTTYQQVIEKWSVPPEKLGDVLALAGDTVDNVPGVPGIGPKTAAALINEYGSLDNLLNNIDQIKQTKRRETLQQHIEQARLSRKLVELDTNVPHDIMVVLPNNKMFNSVRTLRMEPINVQRLLEFYDDMGFRELKRTLEQKLQGATKMKRPSPSSARQRPKATIPLPEDFYDVPF